MTSVRCINSARPGRVSRILLAASLGLSAILGATPAAADDGGAKQAVLAFGEADGTKRVRSGVQVTSTGSNTAAPENLAGAEASCSGCRTVAVAVQAVLITRPSDVIAPKNAAVAVNSDCHGCETMAAAYQCVVTTSGPVTIGADGERKIVQLRSQIAGVAGSDAAFAEIDAQLDALVAEVWGVIDDALRAANEPNRCIRDKHQIVA